MFGHARNAVDKWASEEEREKEIIEEGLNKLLEHDPGTKPDTPEEPEVLVAPTVNLNGYTTGKWTNEDVVINLTSTNAGITYECSNDGTNWQTCSDSITINEDQDKNYKFRTKNTKGETSPETESYNVKRDTVAPTLEIAVDNPNWDEVNISITNSNDDRSGIVEYTYSHKKTSQDDSKYVLDYTGTNNFATFNPSSTTTYKIKVTAIDRAGNETVVLKDADIIACFTAGTQVFTESGIKNIEDIKLGDKVWTINMDNNGRELMPVIKLLRGESNEIYIININGERIEATPKHQFYIVDKGWVRACNLKEGDILLAKDNRNLVIEKIEYKKLTTPVNIYNLTVDGNHNYLITEYEILVHNAGFLPSAERDEDETI